jgi:two-component system response regulator AtoC
MKMVNILIADDEPSILKLHTHMVEELGYTPVLASDGEDAIKKITPDIKAVLLDIKMPEKDGIEVLDHARKKFPELPIIMVSALHDLEIAVKAIKMGAFDYLTKPLDFDRLSTVLRNALNLSVLKEEVTELQNKLRQSELFTDIVGESEKVNEVFELVNKVLETDINVMIIGESGTGKELVAKALHLGSKRREGPFVAVNCSAITTELAESLLFGHKKGSFTGATEDRAGYFEQADKGTLFLDEIGDMDLEIQAKVLRILEEKNVRRLGEKEERLINFRVISATNRELSQAASANNFRQDLYFRLEEYPIYLPPLRERKEDLPLLAQHFLNEFCESNSLSSKQFSKNAIQKMVQYSWPGNIRELKNVVRRTAIRADTDLIDEMEFGKLVGNSQPEEDRSETTSGEERQSLEGEFTPLNEIEKQAIEKAYFHSDRNAAEAAKLLGISRATMYRKLKQFGYEA